MDEHIVAHEGGDDCVGDDVLMGAVEQVSHRLTRSTRRKRAGELVERAAIKRAAEAVGCILKQMSPQAC